MRPTIDACSRLRAAIRAQHTPCDILPGQLVAGTKERKDAVFDFVTKFIGWPKMQIAEYTFFPLVGGVRDGKVGAGFAS
jgi:hypothetical protein